MDVGVWNEKRGSGDSPLVSRGVLETLPQREILIPFILSFVLSPPPSWKGMRSSSFLHHLRSQGHSREERSDLPLDRMTLLIGGDQGGKEGLFLEGKREKVITTERRVESER